VAPLSVGGGEDLPRFLPALEQEDKQNIVSVKLSELDMKFTVQLDMMTAG
jgi:hypothetical protein